MLPELISFTIGSEGALRPSAAIRFRLERSQKLPGGSTLDGVATDAEHALPLVL